MSLLKTDQGVHFTLAEYLRGHLEILNALPHPIFIVDLDFNIVFINNAMKIIYNDSGNLVHMKCYHMLHNSDRASENCPLTNFMKNRQIELAEIYSPFLKKHLLVYSAPLIYKENLIGAIHSVMDISKIVKSEKNSKELVEIYADTLNNMKIREQKAQTGREAFFNMLEDLNESYKELEELFIKLIRVMINALDAKSPWTKGHSERVSIYAEQIALEMSIDSEEVKNIRLAGILHDIGKIGTYDHLLDKPGKLTIEEYEIVKKHPAQGAVILQGIKQLKDIIPMIEYHHEKIDGTGYPYMLKGEEIPIGAKILHVADSFDSMTSDRPYRFAPGIEFALSELNKYRGKQFDPQVVDAFFKVLEKQKK